MNEIKSFTDLKVWQKSHTLTLFTYQITKTFPKEELFGLTSQIRRSAISIESNIAEGFNRRGQKEKIQFLHVALGSTSEFQTQLMISKDLEYLSNTDFQKIFSLSTEVHKMLNTIIKKLNKF